MSVRSNQNNSPQVAPVTPCAPQPERCLPSSARGVTCPAPSGFAGQLRGFRASTTPREHGVALVITLILLAVITFMAITFLAIARRERGSVSGLTDQTTARLAADAMRDRAIAEIIAAMLAGTNGFGPDLLVSTN